jgi:hypothetical protein
MHRLRGSGPRLPCIVYVGGGAEPLISLVFWSPKAINWGLGAAIGVYASTGMAALSLETHCFKTRDHECGAYEVGLSVGQVRWLGCGREAFWNRGWIV